jgi:hypothetical protein
MPTDPLRNSLVDQFSTQDLNFHQRRITNAHPSIDDFDYVVRKELRKLQDDLLKKISTIGVGSDTETHVFGVSGDVSVVTSGFPPLILEHTVTLVALHTCFNIAPTGSDFEADIFLRSSGLSILNIPIVIPAGSTNVVEYTSFLTPKFVKGDVLLCNITQVGSTTPGTMWTAYMLFKVLGD